MIARASIGQNPFAVWGNGEQVRNWTHVAGIVEGLHSTIDWYSSSKNRDRVSVELPAKLLER